MARLTPLRAAVWLLALAISVPPVLVAGLAAGWPAAGAAGLAVLLAACALSFVLCLAPERLGPDPYHHALFGAWMVLSLAAAWRLGGLSVFMLDSERTAYALDPPVRPLDDEDLARPFYRTHNCFTAYVVAAHLAAEGRPGLYQQDHYHGSGQPTPIHGTIGERFTVDLYQYPPPFLLLPQVFAALGLDFFQARGLWFALNVGALCAGLVALSVWIAGPAFGALWLALPLVLLAPATLATLQIGNAHLLVLCMALMAMLAFEQRRDPLGGLLLAFAMVSKIFPGVLLVYLLLRRRWRAALWTGGWTAVLCAGATMLFGWQPFKDFFTSQLPRIASGEAFWFTRTSLRAMLVNTSFEGLAWKLLRLDLLGGLDAAALGSVLKWVFTVMVLAAAALLGLRHAGAVAQGREQVDAAAGAARLGLVQCWLVLLVLGQMRSPFLPWDYGNVAVLWLLALLVPDRAGSVWRLGLLGLAWAFYGVTLPLPLGPRTVMPDLAYTTLAAVAAVLWCLILAWRLAAPRISAAPVGPALEEGPGQRGSRGPAWRARV